MLFTLVICTCIKCILASRVENITKSVQKIYQICVTKLKITLFTSDAQ